MYFCFLCGESLIEVGMRNGGVYFTKGVCVCSKCSAVWYVTITYDDDETISYSLHCTEPDVEKIKERIDNEYKD